MSVQIGSRWELFVDRYMIERMIGAELRLHEPQRREVVLVQDQPWEGKDGAYYSVLQDGGKVRLYYRGYCPEDSSKEQVTCCAESEDGVHFMRPELGLFEFHGSRANNIVWMGDEAHNLAPFVDTNPAVLPEQRYKALAGAPPVALCSPDGIHWRRLSEGPVMADGAFDSLNTARWDDVAGYYRSYSRYWSQGGWDGARAIQSCTSADFLTWSAPQHNVYQPGVPLEHFYTNAVVRCPGAEHIFLSFPKRFVQARHKVQEHQEPGVSDAIFMSSRDGVHWDRTFLEAWLRPGLDPRNWTQRSNMPAWGIVDVDPREHSLYASEHYSWDDNRLRRVTVRRHGFASIHAGHLSGEVITRPFAFAGSRLLLNYATSAAGAVQVEIQDKHGHAIEGFTLNDMPPLYGDDLEETVVWKHSSDVRVLEGQTILLRFVLQDADVFAFRFA
jgi:hypothetical protein